MLEALLIPTILEATEAVAIPALGAWVASEVIGGSKSKHNSLTGLLLGLLKAVGKELTEQEEKTPPAPPSAPSRKDPEPKPKARRTPARRTPARGAK